jgi:putative addiction module killer protein
VKLTIREYLDDSGQSPFRRWLSTLESAARARVQARVLRFEEGNLGDHKQLGAGVWEARLTFGPGYRVYFGKDGPTIVLLLLGGDKGTQTKDIKAAKQFWTKYLEDKRNDKA